MSTLLFHEPGRYILEVVLAYSHVQPMEDFPLANPNSTEPLFEGYLISGAPSVLEVRGAQPEPPKYQRAQCQFHYLFETSTTSALENHKWTVASKTNDKSQANLSRKSDNFTFEEYKWGPSSIGFQMQYHHRLCHLKSMTELEREIYSLPQKWVETAHLVMIGDSQIFGQNKMMSRTFSRKLRTTLIKTHDGLTIRLPQIRETLHRLSNEAVEGERFYVMFNAGLHEIARMCSSLHHSSRSRLIRVPDEHYSCIHEYKTNLNQLVELVLDFPAKLRIYQDTSAGWLRWGNYGFAWPPDSPQLYPLDFHACLKFNQVAWDILQAKSIPVMDTFWLSLSRPDHREIDILNSRGKKIVHLGVELYDVLLRKFLSAILLVDKSFSEKGT